MCPALLFIIGVLAILGIAIMTLFSTCCGLNESDDGHAITNPRNLAIPANRSPPAFRTVRYDQTRSQTPPYTEADAASNATTRSSQLSPRATPSGRNRPAQAAAASTDARDVPHTRVENYGIAQSVSSSVYSQPSQPRIPPSAGTVRYVGRQEKGEEAVGGANEEQMSEEPSMDEIRKFMGDEEQKK
ncbi:hypothetical protein E8E11_004162 [Didymella keratinophila]|nr:hypothetical protein E8E11_004162 [Didymella keratinophila]